MKKSIAIIEGRRIKKYRLGAVGLPLTVVRKHLYRTDDILFHKDLNSDESILFTELESTQAYGDGRPESVLDPDEAIAILDTSYSSGRKAVGFVNMIIANPMILIYGAVAVVVVLSVFGVKL